MILKFKLNRFEPKRLSMNIRILFFLVLVLLLPNMAFSHSNHGQPLNDGQAIIVASKYLEIMVGKSAANKDGKLDSSWMKVTDKKIFKKGLQYFIVSFKNVEKEKTLYLLLNVYGEYKAANFHGNFKKR